MSCYKNNSFFTSYKTPITIDSALETMCPPERYHQKFACVHYVPTQTAPSSPAKPPYPCLLQSVKQACALALNVHRGTLPE
mmetsp:Transcript_8259/g.11368  ORF Transcript_8259/g.11368 Transcript_8259/m.11368 type:complete len:81 (-) Transcript_8259:786-1028(-)